MIPLYRTPHYAARPAPPSCDFGHARVFMQRDGANVLYADNGAAISAGPRYRCPKCRRRVYTEVYT